MPAALSYTATLVDRHNLTSTLGVNQTFTLEVIPTKGAVLHIERTTPIYMDLINFLN